MLAGQRAALFFGLLRILFGNLFDLCASVSRDGRAAEDYGNVLVGGDRELPHDFHHV